MLSSKPQSLRSSVELSEGHLIKVNSLQTASSRPARQTQDSGPNSPDSLDSTDESENNLPTKSSGMLGFDFWKCYLRSIQENRNWPPENTASSEHTEFTPVSTQMSQLSQQIRKALERLRSFKRHPQRKESVQPSQFSSAGLVRKMRIFCNHGAIQIQKQLVPEFRVSR